MRIKGAFHEILRIVNPIPKRMMSESHIGNSVGHNAATFADCVNRFVKGHSRPDFHQSAALLFRFFLTVEKHEVAACHVFHAHLPEFGLFIQHKFRLGGEVDPPSAHVEADRIPKPAKLFSLPRFACGIDCMFHSILSVDKPL